MSEPPVLAILILVVGGLAGAFFWAVAELIQRARWAALLLDPPSLRGPGSDSQDDALTPFADPMEAGSSIEDLAAVECSEEDRG